MNITDGPWATESPLDWYHCPPFWRIHHFTLTATGWWDNDPPDALIHSFSPWLSLSKLYFYKNNTRPGRLARTEALTSIFSVSAEGPGQLPSIRHGQASVGASPDPSRSLDSGSNRSRRKPRPFSACIACSPLRAWQLIVAVKVDGLTSMAYLNNKIIKFTHPAWGNLYRWGTSPFSGRSQVQSMVHKYTPLESLRFNEH